MNTKLFNVIITITNIAFTWQQMTGTICRAHTDCPLQQVCIASGYCSDGQPTGAACYTDQQCAIGGTSVGVSGSVCKSGFCIRILQTGIPPNPFLPNGQYCDTPYSQPYAPNGYSPQQCTAMSPGSMTTCITGYQCSRYGYCCSSTSPAGQYCDSPSTPYLPNGYPSPCSSMPSSSINQCSPGYQCSRYGYCCTSTGAVGQYCDNLAQPYMPNGYPVPCNSANPSLMNQCSPGYQCSRYSYCCSGGVNQQYCDIPSQQPYSPIGFPVQCSVQAPCTFGYQCSRYSFCCGSSSSGQYCDTQLQQPLYGANGYPTQCSSGICQQGYMCSRSNYCCSSSGFPPTGQYCDNPSQNPLSQNGMIAKCSSYGSACPMAPGYQCSRYGYCCLQQSGSQQYCDLSTQQPYYTPSGIPVQCNLAMSVQQCQQPYQCSRLGYCCMTSQSSQYCDTITQQPQYNNGYPMQCGLSTGIQQCNIQMGYQCSRFGYCCSSVNTGGVYGSACTGGYCTDPSMECINGRCMCRQGYTYTGQYCIRGISKLNDPCYSAASCTITNSICSISGICICVTGYKADPTGLSCIKETKPLNSDCQTNAECNGAFVRCFSNKCVCQEGFYPGTEHNCRPYQYNCLYGEALRNSGQPVECEIYTINPMNPNQPYNPFRPIDGVNNTNNGNGSRVITNSTMRLIDGHNNTANGNETLKQLRRRRQVIWPQVSTYAKPDTCPEKFYCNSYSNPASSAQPYNAVNMKIRGFCCPEQKLVCPAGQPYVNSPGCLNCPDNYFCFYGRFGTGTGSMGYPATPGVCCPKPCINNNELYINGQCVSAAKLGEPCFDDDQCGVSQSKCMMYQFGVNNPPGGAVGQCSCVAGLIASNGNCIRTGGGSGYNLCDSGMIFTGEYCSQALLYIGCQNGGRCTYSQVSATYLCCSGV